MEAKLSHSSPLAKKDLIALEEKQQYTKTCLYSADSLEGYTVFLNNTIEGAYRFSLVARISKHNGRMAFRLLGSTNLVVLPNKTNSFSSSEWTAILLGEPFEEPALKVKQQNRRRAQELLYHNIKSFFKSDLSDALKKLKDPDTLVLSLDAFEEVLDFFDSSHPDWHKDRGLPIELASRMDLMAITKKTPLPNSSEHFQEYCTVGLTESGEPDIHRLHLDAPMGSAVIQTAVQYRYYQDHKAEVTKRYYDRVKLFKRAKNETVKKPVKTTFYCAICKENVKDLQRHIEGIKHSTAVIRDKEVYKAIDKAFTGLKEGSEKGLLEPTVGTVSTADTDIEGRKEVEENKVPRKKKEKDENKRPNKRKFNELKEVAETGKRPENKRMKNRQEDISKILEIPKVEGRRPGRGAGGKKKESVSNSTLEKFGIFLSQGACNKSIAN